MANNPSAQTPGDRGFQPLQRGDDEPTALDFRKDFGEDLDDVLNLATWRTDRDLTFEYQRIEQEVGTALRLETDLHRRVRTEVFPKLSDPAAPLDIAGVFPVKQEILESIHRGLLFSGKVESCDGRVQVHDTLPLTIYQVGVSLVSYRGDQGTWHQRLFRRDLKQKLGDPVEETLKVLEQRARRIAMDGALRPRANGELIRKALLDYAERAVLLYGSEAIWRIGHGSPITYELLTGANILELMVRAGNMMRKLFEGHRKFVFVASEPRDDALLTIGHALLPGHYALVFTLDCILREWFQQERFKIKAPEMLRWDEESIKPTEWIPRFIERVASQIVVGVYRASLESPAHLFYAHREHAHYAAHLVIADSRLQPQRGFPLLIDLAGHVCSSVFAGGLDYLTETAYAAAGAPFRYVRGSGSSS